MIVVVAIERLELWIVRRAHPCISEPLLAAARDFADHASHAGATFEDALTAVGVAFATAARA